MAIYGNLTEFPFLEVISMLAQRTGVLQFSHLRPYESVELRLERGQLQAMSVDGVPILDVSMAHSYLSEIAAKRVGDFEFKKYAALNPRQPLKIVVRDALLRGDTAEDARPILEDHLPDPQTRFVMGAVPVTLSDANLKAFWIKAQPSLVFGSSAEQIAKELRLEVTGVQRMLYQLRTVGAIRPVRRIEETMPTKPHAVQPHAVNQTTQATATQATPKPTLVSRLLGALSFMRRAS